MSHRKSSSSTCSVLSLLLITVIDCVHHSGMHLYHLWNAPNRNNILSIDWKLNTCDHCRTLPLLPARLHGMFSRPLGNVDLWDVYWKRRYHNNKTRHSNDDRHFGNKREKRRQITLLFFQFILSTSFALPLALKAARLRDETHTGSLGTLVLLVAVFLWAAHHTASDTSLRIVCGGSTHSQIQLCTQIRKDIAEEYFRLWKKLLMTEI